METVGSYEAKTHFPKLLDKVAAGERIAITRHGVPVAMLVPARPSEQPDRKQVIEALRAFRRGRTLGDLALRDMIEEGRRF
jgi:prevent-host-death family protein